MERIGKVFVLFFLSLFFTGCFSKTWVYDLPNNYKLRKINDLKVEVGLIIDDDFYLNYEDKKVGVDDYVAEFQYSENFIGLKCVRTNEDTEIGVEVLFFIIDTINQNVYGPYSDEETYLAVSGVVTNGESFGEFITTTEVPDGANFK